MISDYRLKKIVRYGQLIRMQATDMGIEFDAFASTEEIENLISLKLASEVTSV